MKKFINNGCQSKVNLEIASKNYFSGGLKIFSMIASEQCYYVKLITNNKK